MADSVPPRVIWYEAKVMCKNKAGTKSTMMLCTFLCRNHFEANSKARDVARREVREVEKVIVTVLHPTNAEDLQAIEFLGNTAAPYTPEKVTVPPPPTTNLPVISSKVIDEEAEVRARLRKTFCMVVQRMPEPTLYVQQEGV